MTVMRLRRGYPRFPGPWHIRAADQRYTHWGALCGVYVYSALAENREMRDEPGIGEKVCAKCARIAKHQANEPHPQPKEPGLKP